MRAKAASAPTRGGRTAGEHPEGRSVATKPRKSSARRPKVPPPFVPGPARSGRRLAPAYDLEGPRVRLGALWFVVVFASLWVSRVAGDFPLVGLVYAAVAAVAAAQVVGAWAPHERVIPRVTAMIAAALVGMSAALGARMLGAALLVAVALAAIAGAAELSQRRPLSTTLALVLQAALPPGLVAASVTLTLHYEIGAGVILLAIVMAFDLGDFLIGSGAGSVYEGPIGGGLVIGLVAAVAAVIGAPPFHGWRVWLFAVGAMVACPLGQVVASWLLPDAATRAPALRRLDSLLVLGPLWAFATGLVVS